MSDVVYSDVKFIKRENATETASENTYSDIGTLKAEPSADLSGSKQQADPNGGSKDISEKVAIAVLSALLAAALIALGFTSHKTIQTMEHVQMLIAENKNLTERPCGSCNIPPTCPRPPFENMTDPCMKCKDGWEKHEDKCYYFSAKKLSWNESRSECRRQGGDLVQIDSTKEQQYLEWRLKEKMEGPEDKFWIGLTDSEKEGTWLWVNGSQLNPSLKFWSGTEPDNWSVENSDGEDCARMGEKAGSPDLRCWFDKSCTATQSSICEKSLEIGHLKCV